MRNDDCLELEWATFRAKARLGSQSGETLAVARSEKTRLFREDVEGIPHLIVEDDSLVSPASIPWTNIASFGVRATLAETSES